MKKLSYSDLLLEKEADDIGYQDLLSTIEWFQKREEIITRDGKRCSKCHYGETGGYAHHDPRTNTYTYLTDDGSEETQFIKNSKGEIIEVSIPRLIVTYKPYFLQVHHKYYIYNTLPWEYDNQALITLCNWCHIEVHQNEIIIMYANLDEKNGVELIPCNRCDGLGWFSEYSHVQGGVCFKCLGNRFENKMFD